MNLASLEQTAPTTSIHPRYILSKAKYKQYPCLYMKELKNKFGLDRTSKWARIKFRIKVQLKSQFRILPRHGLVKILYLELQTSKLADSYCSGKLTSRATTFMKRPRPNSEFNEFYFRFKKNYIVAVTMFGILREHSPLKISYLELKTSKWADSCLFGKLTSRPTNFMKRLQPISDVNVL